MIDQEKAAKSLMRRQEILSALQIAFGEKNQKDQFGKTLEQAIEYDPDTSKRVQISNVMTMNRIKELRKIARETFPAQKFG